MMPEDMRIGPTDDLGLKVTGDYVDKVFKNGKLVQTIEGHNLVVNNFLILTMLLMKRQAGMIGLSYWAVGSGSASWDDGTIPSPSRNETALIDEIGRVEISPSDIVFLDSNFEVTNTPTNIIKITTTFGAADCNGAWREFGLFGGNATSSADSGYMIDKRNHTLLNKTSDMVVERSLRLTIQFA